MRWALVASVSAVLALGGATVAAAGVKPVLRLGAGNAVRGSHFKAHELVRISVASNVRVIRVSAAGSFAALLPAPSDSCGSVLIRATGASGDVAALALSRGLCPPPGANGGLNPDDVNPHNGSVPPGTTLPDPHGPASINLG
jgi:hypothetical protein